MAAIVYMRANLNKFSASSARACAPPEGYFLGVNRYINKGLNPSPKGPEGLNEFSITYGRYPSVTFGIFSRRVK